MEPLLWGRRLAPSGGAFRGGVPAVPGVGPLLCVLLAMHAVGPRQSAPVAAAAAPPTAPPQDLEVSGVFVCDGTTTVTAYRHVTVHSPATLRVAAPCEFASLVVHGTCADVAIEVNGTTATTAARRRRDGCRRARGRVEHETRRGALRRAERGAEGGSGGGDAVGVAPRVVPQRPQGEQQRRGVAVVDVCRTGAARGTPRSTPTAVRACARCSFPADCTFIASFATRP